MEDVLVTEKLFCPNCAKEGLILKWKEGPWFVFRCPACHAEIPVITFPDSNFWAIFKERIKTRHESPS